MYHVVIYHPSLTHSPNPTPDTNHITPPIFSFFPHRLPPSPPSLYSVIRKSIAAIANVPAPSSGFGTPGYGNFIPYNAYEDDDDGDYGGYHGVYGYGGGYESTETKKTKFTAMAKQILTTIYDRVRDSEDEEVTDLTTFLYIYIYIYIYMNAICPRNHGPPLGRQDS
jgi:hypothetical protein